MKTNVPNYGPRTFNGAPALPALTPIQQLQRTVLACMLWEDGFYEDGQAIGQRIKTLVHACAPSDVSALAIEARDKMRLRHAPLLLVRELARHPAKPVVTDVLAQVIQRPDELTEFVSLYWADGKQPLSAAVKRGLAQAFGKFNAYQLGKYNRDGAVKLRDVLFLSHAKPKDEEQAAVWKQLADGTLPAPDTWEVALSGGAAKRATFTRLLEEGKLGYLALLRNLRNMVESGVDRDLIGNALLTGAATSKALPFRYVAAARAVPQLEPIIDQAMQLALAGLDRMNGKTVVLVDVSGSMSAALSGKSDLTRLDAACALAALVRGVAPDTRVFSFSNALVEVAPRSGMALVDAIRNSQPNASTYLGQAIEHIKRVAPGTDRLIVFTDEESHDAVGSPIGRGYMINVASGKNAVGFGEWTRITGFSESVISYIQAVEK